MKASGKTKREIAEHFGLTTEQVKELLKRYRRKERKISAGGKQQPPWGIPWAEPIGSPKNLPTALLSRAASKCFFFVCPLLLADP